MNSYEGNWLICTLVDECKPWDETEVWELIGVLINWSKWMKWKFWSMNAVRWCTKDEMHSDGWMWTIRWKPKSESW